MKFIHAGVLALAIAACGHAATAQETSRTVDGKYLLVNGVQLGTTMFDIAMTQHCIANSHCREGNPLMPSSRAGQITVGVAFAVSGSGISYWLKKHKSRLWWLPPVSGAATHAVGVVTGLEHD